MQKFQNTKILGQMTKRCSGRLWKFILTLVELKARLHFGLCDTCYIHRGDSQRRTTAWSLLNHPEGYRRGMKMLNFFCNQIPLSLLGSKYMCLCLSQTKCLTTPFFPENIFNTMATGVFPSYFALYPYFFFALSADVIQSTCQPVQNRHLLNGTGLRQATASQWRWRQ